MEETLEEELLLLILVLSLEGNRGGRLAYCVLVPEL